MKFFLATLLFILTFDFASAVDIEPRIANLYDIIRCPTCEGQSIKDSNAESAVLIRKNVTRLVNEGISDDEILAKIRTIYGDGAVTIPSTSLHNILLWFFPMIVVMGLGIVYRNTLRSNSN